LRVPAPVTGPLVAVALALVLATAVAAQQAGDAVPASAADSITTAQPPSAAWDASSLMEDVELLTAADLPSLQARAESGDARSQVLLGLAHEFGSAGLPSQPRTGLEWFLKAAAQGVSWAEAWAADFYLHGAADIERDLPRAQVLYTSAANRGDARAAFMLGQMHFFGDGVATDMSIAHDWFRRAGSDDSPLAVRMAEFAGIRCESTFCTSLRQVLGAMASASAGRLVDAWDDDAREWNATVVLTGSERCGMTTSDRTEAGALRDFFCDSPRLADDAAGLARVREMADWIEQTLPQGYARTERLDGRSGPSILFTRDDYPKVRVAFNTTTGMAQHRVTLLVGR
jgi:hypothetical protein